MLLFAFLCMLPVGVFLGALIAGATNAKSWKYCIIMVISSLLITGLIAGALTLERSSDEERWNNGVCSVDGTELHFVNATATRATGSTNTKYYYECENGHIYEFEYLHENVKG